MKINVKKTIYKEKSIFYKQQRLEEVSVSEYLGSVITSNGKLNLEIADRGQKATNINHAVNMTILAKNN